MKAIIFSDSHKMINPMLNAIEKEKDIDFIIHAGDMLCDVEDLKIIYPDTNIIYVKGNNDYWERNADDERFFTLADTKIFLTHGHTYGVKYSSAAILKRSNELGADICIFGHTHSAVCEKVGNLWLFNPGTAYKTYGLLEIKDGSLDLKICNI